MPNWHKSFGRAGDHLKESLITRLRQPRIDEEKIAQASVFGNQADEQNDRYNATEDLQYLYNVEKLLQKAVDILNGEGPSILGTSRNNVLIEFLNFTLRIRASTLRQLWLATTEIRFLKEAINIAQNLQEYAAQKSSNMLETNCLLAQVLSDRYFADNETNQEDWNEAQRQARAAQLAPDKLKKQMLLDNDGKNQKYEAAIQVLDSPAIRKAEYLFQNGIYAQRRSTSNDVAQAYKYHKEASDLLPSTHPRFGTNLIQLANCELNLIILTNDTSRLQETLTALIQMDISRLDAKDVVRLKATISDLWRAKYDSFDDIADLNEAVDVAEGVVDLARIAEFYQSKALRKLGKHLTERAHRTRSQADLRRALPIAEAVLRSISEDDTAELARAEQDLATILGLEYSLFGIADGLERSLKLSRQAVARIPSSPVTLHNLANSLDDHYTLTADNTYLTEAIQTQRLALACNNDRKLLGFEMLSGLAELLEKRSIATNDSRDLSEAISSSEKVVQELTDNGPRFARHRARLASQLLRRGRRAKNIADLNRAIQLLTELSVASSRGSQSNLFYNMDLARCLDARSDLMGSVGDLDQATDIIRDVLRRSPTKRAIWYFELATCLLNKSRTMQKSTEKKILLDEAVIAAQDAVDLCPDSHIDKAAYLHVLADMQLGYLQFLGASKEDDTRTKEIYEHASVLHEQVFALVNAKPIARLASAKIAGWCYDYLQDWTRAVVILPEAVRMIPKVSPLLLHEDDRQRQLRDAAGIVSFAFIAFVKLRQAEKALEILDAGRGIMANIAIRQHDELSELKEVDLHKWQEYITLRDRLSMPIKDEPSGEDIVATKIKLQEAFDSLENEIRLLPGMEGFNQSLTSNQIRRLAGNGPLVLFRTSIDTAYALIVMQDKIDVLDLPGIAYNDLKEKIPLVVGDNRLSLWPPSKRAQAAKKMKLLLKWLWDGAVKPVLAHLDILDSKPDLLPRIWWITSGELGLMPLHAAGQGAKFHGENTYDHVVSSYISTCAALDFARKCQAKVVVNQDPKVILVAMRETPGRSRLETIEEESAVRDSFASSEFTEMLHPLAAHVLDAVRNTSTNIFHFCCHGEPDIADPSKTALLFGNDPDASEPDPLRIGQLREYNGSSSLKTPQLAYLSGCCTAQQYDLKLIDESIHLASMFQLLGFPSVIGTLWEADDKAAAFIAKAFYRELIRLRTVDCGVPNEDHIVRALHAATAACRGAKFGKTKGAEDVLLWANFVYWGA